MMLVQQTYLQIHLRPERSAARQACAVCGTPPRWCGRPADPVSPAQDTSWGRLQMQPFALMSQQSSRTYPKGALWGLGYGLGVLHVETLSAKMSMCIEGGAEH